MYADVCKHAIYGEAKFCILQFLFVHMHIFTIRKVFFTIAYFHELVTS